MEKYWTRICRRVGEVLHSTSCYLRGNLEWHSSTHKSGAEWSQKEIQGEGNSRPTVSVTEDLLFQLHVNCMFVEWSLRKNGISARNLFVKFEHNLKWTLHKKWSFLLRISSVNVTKPAVNCGFGHNYWRNPQW